MAWLQLHLTSDKATAQRIEESFEALGALSISFTDAEDEPILELGPGETRLWQRTRTTALFAGETDPDTLRSELSQQLGQDLCRDLQVEWLQDQAWERAWLDHFKPMRFGERLWICPSGHRVDAADAIVIDLDPGLAFGTGTHPTTALCLEWLEQADLSDKHVIDFGCGSGILAIAALKLGAVAAHGTDHDPQAITASRDNALRNHCSEQLQLHGPDDPGPPPAGIVVANILSGTLIQLADLLVGLVRPGGELILSGILDSQADEVIAHYLPILPLRCAGVRDGWVLLYGRRLG